MRKQFELPLAHRLLLLAALLCLWAACGYFAPPAAPPPGRGARAAPPATAADAAQCVASQRSLITSGRAAAARDALPWPRRRKLAVLVRAHAMSFAYVPAHLLERRSAPGVEWDYFFVFDTPAGHEELAAFLAARGLSHLAGAFTPLYLNDWLPLSSKSGDVYSHFLPSGEKVVTVDKKTLLGMLAVHPCYEAVLSLDLDCIVLDPATLVRGVKAKLREGLVFQSLMVNAAAEGIEGKIARAINWGTQVALHQMKPPKEAAAIAAELERLTFNSTFTSFFSDILAVDSLDVPRFLAAVDHPRAHHLGGHPFLDPPADFPHYVRPGVSTWMNFFECAFDNFKLLRGEWKPAPVFVTPSPGDAQSGFVWKMRRGEDWFNILAAHGSAPKWASLELCRDTPRICLERTHGIELIFNLDLSTKDDSFIHEYTACLAVGGIKRMTPFEAFKCAEEKKAAAALPGAPSM